MINNRCLLTALAIFVSVNILKADEQKALAKMEAEEMTPDIIRDEKRPGKPVIEMRFATVVTNAGLKELANFPELQYLDILTCVNIDAGLEAIVGLKKLQTLSLRMCPVTPEGFKNIAKLTQLKSLDIGIYISRNREDEKSTFLKDEHVVEIVKLKDLQTLKLAGSELTKVGMKELSKLTQLKTLDLSWSTKATDGLVHLTGLKLKVLKLSNFEFSENDPKHLANIKTIQSLDLTRCELSEQSVQLVATLPNLESLQLAWNKLSIQGLKELQKLKKLKELDLRDSSINDEGMKVLAGFESLQTLDISKTKITAQGLKELKVLKNLQELDVSSCEDLTLAGYKSLSEFKQLKKLWVHGYGVSDETLRELKRALPKCEVSDSSIK